MTKVVIVGVAGFIGTSLVNRMLSTDMNVTIVGIDRQQPISLIVNNRFRFVQCDVTSDTIHYDIIAAADVVYWKVGLKGGASSVDYSVEHDYMRINTKSISKLIESGALQSVGRFAFDSSEQVYGTDYDFNRRPDNVPVPSNFYGFSKVFSERMLLHYYLKIGKPQCLCIFRYPRIHDVGIADVINKMVNCAIHDRKIDLFCENKRLTFVDLKSVLDSNILLLSQTNYYGIQHVSSGETITLKDLSGLIRDKVSLLVGEVSVYCRSSPCLKDFEPTIGGLDATIKLNYESICDMVDNCVSRSLKGAGIG